MSWSNWVYLLIGMGLGSLWVIGRRNNKPLTTLPPADALTRTIEEPATNTSVDHSEESLSPLKESNYDMSLEQLKQTQLAYQLAHQMSEFKAGFLVRTSHELRSPLNSLIGLHQLILADLCDDPAEERTFVAQAHSCALKLVKLLDEILDVARVEHGTGNLEIQPLQLAHMLQEVYQLTYMLAANRNFPLELSPADPEIYVLADPRWLRQVLVNLVNACIIQMQEGSICLAVEPVTDVVHIWIDVQPSISAWSEPMDLFESEHTSDESADANATLSSGLSLLLNQTLLESMQGSLKFLAIPVEADESFSRIEVTIPWVIPEAAFPEQEENQG